MISRRNFLGNGSKAAVGASLWLRLNRMQAFAQSGGGYKAVVCIGLEGGNDGNNMLVPYLGVQYAEYAALRGNLALQQASLHPLANGAYSYPVAVHPAMPNVARLFNSGQASFVANVGPLRQPVTKAQLLQDPTLAPYGLLNHLASMAEWESATTVDQPVTGWGGRIADALQGQSGSLPMVLDAGTASIFTVGNAVQGITVQGGTVSVSPIPLALQNAALQLSTQDTASKNALIAQAAKLHALSWQQQATIAQAQSVGNTFQTQFPTTNLGGELGAVAKLINGRSVVGATRQIFYLTQGNHDTHENQLQQQSTNLGDLDASLGAFMQAMGEIGMTNQVLVCTHSDFNRSMQANSTGGSDHAWGNHQMILGGGIRGGKILGTLPELALGGSQDLNGVGTWIPTLSVTQMTAAVGGWIGLSASQLAGVFPDLANFSQGAISLS